MNHPLLFVYRGALSAHACIYPCISPRDAMQSAVIPQYVVCLSVPLTISLSVSLSVTFSWNTSKIISPLIGLRPTLGLTPTWAICFNGNTPKIRVEWGWGQEHKTPAISPKRCKMGTRLEVAYALSIGAEINDLG